MKYNSIGEQLIAKAKEIDPSYKSDKFNDMSEALDIILKNSGGDKVFFNLFVYYDQVNNKITQEGWDKLSNGLINGTYCGILYDEIPLVVIGFNGARTLYAFETTEEIDNASIKITVKSDLTFTIENIPVLNIPALPSDASTKTYTLQTVNGVLTWTDAIGDINTILDNINGEVI